MTVRSPLKFGSSSPNVATGDTYEFYGVQSNAVVFKTNLIRYTLAEANNIISQLDLSAFSSAGLAIPVNFNSYHIGMDGQPGGGYVFMETQDDAGNPRTPWRPWWPKYANRNVYYLQPASNNTNNYQFAGNFTFSQVRGYYSIDVRKQELQEESNVNYLIGLVIDKWLRSTSTYVTGSAAPEGVELRLPHTYRSGSEGYTVYNQTYGNINSWSTYGSASILNLNTHIGVSTPGSTATLHPTISGAADVMRDTRFKASTGVTLTSPPGACYDELDVIATEANFRTGYVAIFSGGTIAQNSTLMVPGSGKNNVVNQIEAWYKTPSIDPNRIPDIDGLRYWVDIYNTRGAAVCEGALKNALQADKNTYGTIVSYYSYCGYQTYLGLNNSGPPSSQGNVQLVSNKYTTVDQWVQPSSTYAGYNEAYRPMYYSPTGQLITMSDADIDDTFIKPAIKYILGESTLPNVDESLIPYTITTSSTSPAGWSRVQPGGDVASSSASASVIFADTVANTSSYANLDLSLFGQDFFYTQTEYFLHKKNYFGSINQLSSGNFTWVRFDDSTNSIIAMSSDELAGYLYGRFKHVIATVPSWRIRYTFHLSNSSSSSSYSYNYRVPLGTNMTDTSTGGQERNLERQYGADDYRYMAVPNGGASTVNYYRLYAVRY